MRIILISMASWLAGLAAYVGTLDALWNQSLRGGDLRAVVSASAVATAIAIAVIYAPVMFALRARRIPPARWWLFPLLAMAIGIIPVFFIILTHGGNLLTAIASPEAGLFVAMFAAFGFVFGTGFFLAYRSKPN